MNRRFRTRIGLLLTVILILVMNYAVVTVSDGSMKQSSSVTLYQDTRVVASYGAHWWKGAQANLGSGPADRVKCRMQVPYTTPSASGGDRWFILLSAISNGGYGVYNQIGIVASQGAWYIMWAYMFFDHDGKETLYYQPFDPGEVLVQLVKGSTYDFIMELSGGVLKFIVDQVGGNPSFYWDKSVSTGAGAFLLNPTAYVGGISYFMGYPIFWGRYVVSFTVYEELWDDAGVTPNCDFRFSSIRFRTLSGLWKYHDSWRMTELRDSNYPGGIPSGISVTWSSTEHYVNINNP